MISGCKQLTVVKTKIKLLILQITIFALSYLNTSFSCIHFLSGGKKGSIDRGETQALATKKRKTDLIKNCDFHVLGSNVKIVFRQFQVDDVLMFPDIVALIK